MLYILDSYKYIKWQNLLKQHSDFFSHRLNKHLCCFIPMQYLIYIFWHFILKL